jgi:hypothetical protein
MSEPLDFDFENLHGQCVTAIKGANLQLDEVGRSRYQELVIVLEQGVLHLSVNTDTDEVIVRTDADAASLAGFWVDVDVLKEYLGYELGWCWVARSYLGYADTLMVSFSGIEPEIAVCAVASRLWIYRMTRI